MYRMLVNVCDEYSFPSSNNLSFLRHGDGASAEQHAEQRLGVRGGARELHGEEQLVAAVERAVHSGRA